MRKKGLGSLEETILSTVQNLIKLQMEQICGETRLKMQ